MHHYRKLEISWEFTATDSFRGGSPWRPPNVATKVCISVFVVVFCAISWEVTIMNWFRESSVFRESHRHEMNFVKVLYFVRITLMKLISREYHKHTENIVFRERTPRKQVTSWEYKPPWKLPNSFHLNPNSNCTHMVQMSASDSNPNIFQLHQVSNHYNKRQYWLIVLAIQHNKF